MHVQEGGRSELSRTVMAILALSQDQPWPNNSPAANKQQENSSFYHVHTTTQFIIQKLGNSNGLRNIFTPTLNAYCSGNIMLWNRNLYQCIIIIYGSPKLYVNYNAPAIAF